MKGKKEIRQQDLLLGEQVVLQLTENFWGKWHHIYFDNYFSSTNLMKMLLEQETYSCTAVALQGQIEKIDQQILGNQLS